MPIVIHQRSPILPRILLILSAAVLVWTAPGDGAKAGQQEGPSGKERMIFPHMDAALGLLQQAQNQLEHAEPAFYGHRVKAMEHVKAGIVDLQTGINDYL